MQLNPRWKKILGILSGVLTPVHILLWLAAPIAFFVLDREFSKWQLGIQSFAIFCIGMAVWAWIIKFLYFPEINTTGKNIAYAIGVIFLFIISLFLWGCFWIFIYGL